MAAPEGVTAMGRARRFSSSVLRSRAASVMGTLALLIAAGAAATAPAGAVDLCITEFSTGNPDTANPYGITAGPDGALWFVENGANEIGRITPAGELTEFTITTAYSAAQMITAGPDGNLWFTEFGSSGDHNSGKIGRITPDGDITEFPVYGNPWGIAAGPDGNLWYTTFFGAQIGRITPEGVITTFPVPTTTTLAITAGPDGNLWFTEPYVAQVGKITPDGDVTEFAEGISSSSNPHGITAGPDGNVWFVEVTGNRVGRITPGGVVTEFSAGISPGSSPEHITTGPDGNLWFTEPTGNRIARITPAGVVSEFSDGITSGAYPYGIAAGSDSSIWFTEFNANQIGRNTCAVHQMGFRSEGSGDGWLLEQDEDSGKGGTFDATATTGRLGDDAADRQYRSILDFDTSLLPDDAVVVGVTLKIKKQAIVGTNPLTTHGFLTVDQKTGYYHDNPVLERLDFHAIGSRGNVGRFIKTPADRWYRAPLREPSYSLINLTGHTQFRLRFYTDDNDNLTADYVSFYTGNIPIEDDRPELIITYYVP
jgi:streptogramin lyase